MAESVVFTRVVHSPRFISPAHHDCNLLAALSTTNYSCAAVGLQRPKGRPMYLQGKLPTSQPKIPRANSACSGVHQIGCIEHFARLVRRPEAPPKSATIAAQVWRSNNMGRMKVMTSLAYMVGILLISWSIHRCQRKVMTSSLVTSCRRADTEVATHVTTTTTDFIRVPAAATR